MRGGVVVLDDGGRGVGDRLGATTPRGAPGGARRPRRVLLRVDGGAEGGGGEGPHDGERRGAGGRRRGGGGEGGERDVGEVERDGAREGVGERRAVVLRREGVLGVAGDGGGHACRRAGRSTRLGLGFGEERHGGRGGGEP